MLSRLERFFSLRPGDMRRGILLALYYFLIISSYTEGQVVRDALFLGHFEAVKLPYVDFAIAALVGGVLALYMRIARSTSLTNLLAGSLFFFLTNVVFFWWIARRQSEWLYPVVYIWVGLYGGLAISQVWTLANYVLTGREAKRLFGFIGSGGILGGIFGGFFSSRLANGYGAESLLLAMAISIAICIVLVFAIREQNRNLAGLADGSRAISRENAGTLSQAFRMVRSSPHLLTIASLICICSVVTAIASWQFRAISKEFLVDKNTLAAFFGTFYGYTGALALATQMLLTPRLMRHFGVKAALFVLPIAFVGGTFVLISTAALWSATMLKGTDRIVRYSIDTAALQMLYMPVSPEAKLQVKSFIDTVVLRAGDGVAAVLVLWLTGFAGLSASQLGWVNLALLSLWLISARKAGKEYVATLGESLRQGRLDAERLNVPELDRAATQMLITELRSKDPNKILYVLGLLEAGRWKATYSAVRRLTEHPDPDIRAKAISVLEKMSDPDAVPPVEEVGQMLEHGDTVAARKAARAVAVYQKRQFVPRLIELLANSEIRSAAADALAAFGDNIQGTLRDSIGQPDLAMEARREIPDLLAAVGNPEARRALIANLVQNDGIMRLRIISALNKIQERHPDMVLDAQTIEIALASEIMNHYRAYQVMATVGHLAQESFNVPLNKSLDQDLERIFRLLKILHPKCDLESAFVGLRSKSKLEHDNALEFLDNTLKPAIRRVLLPLVDAEVSLPERVQLANRLLKSTLDSRDDALAVLMNTDDPWSRSCAAHLIGVLGLKQFQKEIDVWASDPDPMVREKAQKAQQRLAAHA